MASYVKATNFAVKDTLASGNPAKIVKGTEIDTELNAIAAAIASKPDADSPTLTGTPLAPTPSTATNNTQISTTAYVVNRIAQDIAGKANIASPTFTGVPAAPTASPGTNTTQLATTAFVAAGLALKSDLASPTFTGTPLAPTATTATNNTQIATTQYVVNRVAQDIAGKADLASPTFTGVPAAPTAIAGADTTQIATTAFVKNAVDASASATAAGAYPIGSIYINATNSTNPATLLGFGTWVSFGTGRVLIGFDSSDPLFDTAEETGGSKNAIAVSHTHSFSATTSSNGLHTHGVSGGGGAVRVIGIQTGAIAGIGDGLDPGGYNTTFNGLNILEANGSHNHTLSGTTGSTGSSGTNANLPPYITVYMWKRTA
jgi:hypothetical protein